MITREAGKDTGMDSNMPKANQQMTSTETPAPHSIFSGAKIERALFALLLVNICLIVYYITFGYQKYFHSDSAMENLLAQEIYETGRYFPSDWYYVNGDLWVLSGYTYILPLLPFFPNSFSLHAASGIFSAFLILVGTWCVAGVVSESFWSRLTSVVVVSSGISGFMAEVLYGQVSYGEGYYFTCFIIFFAWRFLHEESKARWSWGAGMTIFVGLAFWENPQRASAYHALPLLMAGVTYVAVELKQSGGRWSAQAIRGISLLSLFFIGAAAGVALHLWIIGTVNIIPGAGRARWLPFDGMLKNIGYTLQGFLSIFGGLPSPSMPVVSLIGVYEAIRFISAIALIPLLPFGLKLAFQGQNRGTLFFSVFTLVSASLILLLQITTNIPDMSDPVQSSRYLIPPLLLLLLLFIAIMVGSTCNWSSRVLGGVVICVLATSAFSSLMTSVPGDQLSWGMPGQIQDKRAHLVEFLATNELHYGYASFWNAGAISVLSAQRVRVRQIYVDRGLPIPMRHLSSERWYRPPAWTGETFLLLTDNEAKAVNWNLLATYHGQPTRKLQFQKFQIYVFPNNIANGLPNWDTKFETPVRFIVSPQSSHHVGRYLVAGKQAALVANKGETGFLHFGPYTRALPGSYKVSFEVDAAGGGVSEFGTLDVVSDQGRQIHASQTVTNAGRQRITLVISLRNKEEDLEFRVLTTGATQVKLYEIDVVRIGD